MEPPSPSQESPAASRSNLIATSVQFLKDPRVQQAPISQRRAFLEKKGLTAAEIEIAIAQAGIPPETTTSPVPPLSSAAYGVHPNAAIPPPSTWSRIKSLSINALIIGGVMYGAYHFINEFLFHASKKEQLRQKKMEENMEKMQRQFTTGIEQMQKILETINQNLLDEQQKLQVIQQQIATGKDMGGATPADSKKLDEVKNELTSIKGILLSRHQFPPPPVNGPVEIPKWQLEPPADAPVVADEENAADEAE